MNPTGYAGPGPGARRWWWGIGWAMVVFVLYATLSPVDDVPDVKLNDKIEHGLAFFGMTGWFGAVVPRSRFWLLGVIMSALGAAIEVAQGTMGLGRDMDFWDWVADSYGVLAALVVLYAVAWLTGGSWLRLAVRAWRGLTARADV